MSVELTAAKKKLFERGLDKLTATERQVVEKFIHGAKVTRHVEQEFREQLTTGQRVADYVAATMGGWRFIIIQSVLLVVWLVLNVTAYVQHWIRIHLYCSTWRCPFRPHTLLLLL